MNKLDGGVKPAAGAGLKELDLTEGRSTGISKIIKSMAANGSPTPEFETDEERSYFLIRLPVHEKATDWAGVLPGTGSVKSSEKGSERSSERIVALLRESPLATIAEMAINLGLSTRAIEKQLVKLKDSGQVKRIGPDSSGRWEVKEEATDHVPTPVPPEVVVDEASVKTTQETTQETTQKTAQKTTQKIVELLRERPALGRKELAELLGDITEDGVKYHLNKLKAEGVIRRIGPDKGGHWEVLENS